EQRILVAHGTSFLMSARGAGGHVEIVAARAPWPIGSENERSSIEREGWRDVVGCGVERRAEIHGWRPGVVHGLPRGHPEVGSAEPAGSSGPEHQLLAVHPHADGGVVRVRGVELAYRDSGNEGNALARHGHCEDGCLLQSVDASVEIEVRPAVLRALEVHRRVI